MRKSLLLIGAAVLALLVGWGLWRGSPPTPGPDAAGTASRAEAPTPPPSLRGAAAPGVQARDAAPPETATPTQPAPRPRTRPWWIGGPSHDPSTGDVLVRVLGCAGLDLGRVRVRVSPVEVRPVKVLEGGPPDSSGAVLVESVPAGRAGVDAVVGPLRRSVYADVVAGRRTEVEIRLPHVATLEGHVRHAERGPLAGVTMKFNRVDATVGSSSEFYLDTLSAVTDDDGAYRLACVPAGSWTVAFGGGPLGPVEHTQASLTTNGSDPMEHDFVVGRATLRGTVRNEAGGAPIAGAQVKLQETSQSTVTDARGEFSFIDAPAGSVRLTLSVQADGYAHRLVQVPVIEAGVATVDVLLSASAVLLLTIRDESGQPIAGECWLMLSSVSRAGQSVGRSLRADAKGECAFRHAEPGRWTVSIVRDGYAPASTTVDVYAGDNPLSFVLVEKAPGAVIHLHGVVRDSTDHHGLAGVRLQLQKPEARTVETGIDGSYSFRNIPSGAYVLLAAKDGYGFRFLRGTTLDLAGRGGKLDVVLEPASTLVLDIAGPDGRAVVGRCVLGIRPEEGTEGTKAGAGITADAAGRAVFRQIVPGRYRLRIIHGSNRAEVHAVIGPGENNVAVRLK